MANHPLTIVIRERYNKLNAEAHPQMRCRLNEEQLTEQQRTTFSLLNEETKRRYYGTGMVIPENVQGKRILDIGCGSGSLVFILSKLVGPTGYVVGIDVTDGVIQTARSQTEYHCRVWGYDKPNVQFHVLNAERLDQQFSEGEFDVIVSSGVVSFILDKERMFRAAYKVLKAGGQFYLSDAFAESDVPESVREESEICWMKYGTGALRWDALALVVGRAGFTTPYLTSVAPVDAASEHCKRVLGNLRFTCAGWRLFKLDPKAAQKGPALVTYTGGISDHPDCFPWDVDTVFKKGEGVEVDGELTTILSSIYLSDCFSFQPAKGQPLTPRNQNPFQLMDQLAAKGRLPGVIYTMY